MSKNAKVSGKALTVALSTGLFAPHVLIPPTPGPLAAAAALGLNDLGLLILAGSILALVLVLTGGWFATRMNRQLQQVNPLEELPEQEVEGSLARAVLPIILPLLFIAGGTSLAGIEGWAAP